MAYPKGSVVEMVLTNLNIDPTFPTGIARPIHLHGQHFYVVEIGYANYTFDGLHVKSTNDIQCVVNVDNSSCQDRFATVGEKGNLIFTRIKVEEYP